MIKKTAEIDIKSNASATKADIDKLSNSTDKLSNSTKNSSKSIIDSNSAMDIANTLTGGLVGQIKSAADSTGLFSVAQNALTAATGVGTSAMKIFQIAIASTGIGLIIVAVGMLISYMSKLNPVVDKIEQAMGAFGAVVNVVQSALYKLFSGDLGGFLNLSRDIDKATKATIALVKAQQDLDDVLKEQEINNLRAANQYDSLIQKSKNRAISEQDRIKYLKEAAAVETKNFEERKSAADQEVIIARNAIIIKGNLNKEQIKNLKEHGLASKANLEADISGIDELYEKLATAQKKRLGIDNENIKRSEKIQNQSDAANDKIATAAQTANDKASAARQTANDKSQAEKEKNSEAHKTISKKLSTELQDLEDDSEDKKVARKKQRDLDEINALKGINEIKRQILIDDVNKKYAILEQDIENRKNREYAETLEKNRKTDEDNAKNNIKIVLDLVNKNLIKTTYNDATNSAEVDAEFNKNRILLDAQQNKDLGDAIMANATGAQIQQIKDGYNSLQIKNVKEAADKENSIEQAKFDLKMTLWANIGNALGGLSSLFKKGTAAAKAAALAEIAIGSAIGLINGLDIAQKSAKGTGPAAAFAFPIFYATQVAAVFGAVSRAKSVLSGADSASGASMGSASIGGGASAGGGVTLPTAPNIAFQNTPQSQISDTIQSASQARSSEPVKAYIVSNDVTTAQELERNRIESSKF